MCSLASSHRQPTKGNRMLNWCTYSDQKTVDFRTLLAPLEAASAAEVAERIPTLEAQASAFEEHHRVAGLGWIKRYKKVDPRLSLVRNLIVDDVSIAPFRKLMSDANIAGVTGLTVKASLGEKGVDAILASPIQSLRFLKLQMGSGFKAASIEKLRTWPALKELRHLDLSFNEKVGSKGIAALAEAPFLPGLEALELLGCADKAAKKPLQALASVPFERLELFSLSGASYTIAEGRGRPFLTAPGMQKLASLSLYMGLRDEDLATLGKEAVGHSLRTLNVGGEFSSGAVAAFFATPHLQLEELHVRGIQGDLDEGLERAINASSFRPKLQRMTLNAYRWNQAKGDISFQK
ncbi:MAG: hypothetical protein AAF938_03380 [Myxococcota bacterium]